VSLHRVDPRFVLPHRVRRAVVLGGLEEWRAGLVSAGIEVLDETSDGRPPDVVVAPARLAGEARSTRARSIIVEGSRERPFRGGEYRARRLLLRPTRERPTLALPLDQPASVLYALERWSVVDRRWKTARMRAARVLVSRGLFPSWASPVVTVAMQAAGPPALVTAAGELGVPSDVSWFLTFGQGDALSRNAFQLFRAGSGQPEWVLKFARVAGNSKRFDSDERGLELAHAAGDVIAAHAPRLVGRFDADGVHASLETAAAGRRLRDVLRTPGDRVVKLRLIERIGDWILQLAQLTQTSPESMGAERERLRSEVVQRWGELGVHSELVDDLPPLAAVAQHNDLGTWNIVADDGDFVVVDWENAREAALPLWDLLYFLGDAFVLLDGSDAPEHAPEQLPGRIVRLFAGEAPSSPLLFSWVRRAAEAAAVPPDAVGAIATLCWLSHSLSAGVQNVDLAALTPRDPPRLHGFEGMARAWMAHPALGPSWSAWRG
jgi:Phosphotransferase enzyme family